jgi:hypothetical protein
LYVNPLILIKMRNPTLFKIMSFFLMLIFQPSCDIVGAYSADHGFCDEALVIILINKNIENSSG